MAYDASWISQLDEDTPAGTEARNLGDNAIREIKKVLKETFPAAVADDPLTATMAQLNAAVAAQVPRDTVVAWAGNFTTSPQGPTGWTICDGRARRSGGGTAPNLVAKFVFATSPGNLLLPAGITGGNAEIDIKVSGVAKTFTTAGTTLTAAQSGLPSHSHTVTTHAHTGSGGYESGSGAGGVATTLTTSTTGGSSASQSHSHTFQIVADALNPTQANIPPFYALVYIIKD